MAFGEASEEIRSRPTELEINLHIGRRIREGRMRARMSENDLACEAGLDVETIGACESAMIRMSPYTLWQIAIGLGRPIDYFYEGLARPS